MSLDTLPQPGRLHRPHTIEDATLRTKTIQLTLAALLGLSGALPAVATEYQASDYLPLAVGNSWTYHHYYRDVVGEREEGYDDQWPAYFAQEFSAFTIEVLRTEELDGQTYYVISEMPSNWPLAPPHFIAGKKLRWEGTQLMEHSGSGEQAIFRFDGANRAGYDIPTVEGDNRVTVELSAEPVPMYTFYFHGNGEGGRGIGFLAGYGLDIGGWKISAEDYPLFINQVAPLHAVIGGTRVEYEDALIPTSTPVAAAADFDGDGEVGFADFFLFADAFGGSDERFDLDGNGAVDLADFFLFADYFGQPARAKLLVMAQELIGLPDDVQLHQNVPNPFNRQTLISFLMRAPGPARVELFALTGQRVAVLSQGFRRAGSHRLHWDGRDDDDRPLASGTYLYRLVTTDGTVTRKLTLLR